MDIHIYYIQPRTQPRPQPSPQVQAVCNVFALEAFFCFFT